MDNSFQKLNIEIYTTQIYVVATGTLFNKLILLVQLEHQKFMHDITS